MYMLVAGLFFFSNNVFDPIKNENFHLGYLSFVVFKCFKFGLL